MYQSDITADNEKWILLTLLQYKRQLFLKKHMLKWILNCEKSVSGGKKRDKNNLVSVVYFIMLFICLYLTSVIFTNNPRQKTYLTHISPPSFPTTATL